MAAYVLDTSTIMKRYELETGSAWVQALTNPAARHSLFVVRITQAETVAAITRRERGGTITPHDAVTALADFQVDFAHQYHIVEVSVGLVAQAATPARRHALRGYDAVQLAAALEIHAAGPSLTLISADAELNTARMTDFISAESTVPWVNELTRAIGAFFRRLAGDTWPEITPEFWEKFRDIKPTNAQAAEMLGQLQSLVARVEPPRGLAANENEGRASAS